MTTSLVSSVSSVNSNPGIRTVSVVKAVTWPALSTVITGILNVSPNLGVASCSLFFCSPKVAPTIS